MPLIDNIIQWIGYDREVTSKEIIKQFGSRYYCNASKHLGAVMSRAVKSGKVIRVRKGVFKVNDKPTFSKSKEPINPNQSKLF